MIKLKQLFILTFLVLVFKSAVAQKMQMVFYIKDGDKITFSKESADFVRIIEVPDSGINYTYSETYKDGNLKAKGMVSKFAPILVYEGQLTRFYENGNKQSIETYVGGELLGIAAYFLENGKLKQTFEYIKVETSSKKSSDRKRTADFVIDKKLIYMVNTLGQATVKGGNGHSVDVFEKNEPESIEEGDYKDGYKQGIWTAKSPKSNFWYKEEYDQGKLLSGESSNDGISYTYTEAFIRPECKGGMEEFYKYLRRSIRYPEDALRSGKQGKVYLKFIVEKDGTITNIEVTKSVFPSLDAEARRMIKGSPKWNSGYSHGVPVSCPLNLPISFSLN